MDIQKEKEAFQKEMLDSKYVAGNISAFWDEKSQNYDIAINELRMAWHAWQAAKAQAVPEGFVLVPKKPDKDTIIEMAAVCLMPRRKIDDIEFLSISEAKEVYQAMIEAQGPAND